MGTCVPVLEIHVRARLVPAEGLVVEDRDPVADAVLSVSEKRWGQVQPRGRLCKQGGRLMQPNLFHAEDELLDLLRRPVLFRSALHVLAERRVGRQPHRGGRGGGALVVGRAEQRVAERY